MSRLYPYYSKVADKSPEVFQENSKAVWGMFIMPAIILLLVFTIVR